MWDVATYSEPVARKEYRCQACEWIDNMMSRDDLTPEERVLYDIARADGFHILKGEKYRKTDGIWEGSSSVFRARPDMDDICNKYDLYAE